LSSARRTCARPAATRSTSSGPPWTSPRRDAARDDVEYVFGDSITSISAHGDVTFEHAAPRRFDLVVGADGLHSNVRRLVFGDESQFSAFIGAYLAVLTMPNHLHLDGEHIGHIDVGRVTLVGDAGYCPGPAVGGSTSLAVLGAYTLAGELAAAGGDHERALPAYERQMAQLVRHSRAFALNAAKTLIPNSQLGVRALVAGARLVSVLPARVSRAAAKLNSKGVRLHDSMIVRDYADHQPVQGTTSPDS
jgi:2-polyprenyl-6-methoxyphenol hydroxylase-like FAD-dependent oxidoreductase